MEKIKKNIPDIAVFVLGLVMMIGSMTFFSACGPKEDGTYMSCHTAQLAVMTAGSVAAVASLVSLFFKSRVRAVLNVIEFLSGVFAVLAPTVLIHTCMMETMRCNLVMKPCAILFGAAVALASAVAAIINFKKA